MGSATVRAGVMTAIDAPLEIWDDVEVAEPGAGEVLVAMTASGVCHTDLTMRSGALPPGPLPMTTYIKTSETNRYVTLARDIDLRTLAAGRDATAAIPACR